MKNITIKNARLHNLKNINISIPKNKLIVVTGVSGSGKSSLVFDIVFEEGRKQYLQSLGVLTEIDEERKFDSISGISPTVAVKQNIIRQSNPRATVGSKTNIWNLLAILFAREGKISCSSCGSMVDKNLKCRKCGTFEERLPVSYFSYNNPNGVCFQCSGRGAYYEINMDKLVPNEHITLEEVCTSIKITPGLLNVLHRHFKEYMKIPFQELPDEVKADVIYGHYTDGNFRKRSFCITRFFQGQLYKGEDLTGIYEMSICKECHGFRIGEEARRVFLNGKHIGELGLITVTELQEFLTNLLKQKTLTTFGMNLIEEILQKTNSLIKARLGHLSLFREMPSLSGGEIQRLFLNSHLDSKMDSLIYILDEPTSGLHESEKEELLQSIKNLKELGNTVIVVEHDKRTIETAEYLIDIGPKAGMEGGEIIYEGDLTGLLGCSNSLTGQFLSGKEKMPVRNYIDISTKTKWLTIHHAKTNNLKDVTVSLPLGMLVGVAGISGSGKSSLISETLIPLLRGHFRNKRENSGNDFEDSEIDSELESFNVETIADKLEGLEYIAGYAEVSQAPIGRNINSTPITYIGLWDKIRKLFSKQANSLELGLSAGHFSFNSKGACSVCGGSGNEKIWMGGDIFMYNICKECHGKRFNEEALRVEFKNKNIYDVLEMSVSEAVRFFENENTIVSALNVLEDIGMGYIKLGQPTPTLSGGEAQRIKLAKEISKKRKENTLYVLDEPTTGLSLYDTAKLIQLLNELVKKGNSVIVIEHDMEVISVCDWIIELGPGGGKEGGQVIAEGTPHFIKRNRNSIIGKYIRG